MADKLLDDAARIIRREAAWGIEHLYVLTAEVRDRYLEIIDVARQLEARSNSSDHSRGAKEAG